MSVFQAHREAVKPINIHVFRNAVEHILDPETQALAKTLYLLAARVSEILTKSTRTEILKNQSKPLGSFLNYEFQDFRQDKIQEKVLLVTAGVAKRTKVSGKARKQAKKMDEPNPEEVEKAFSKYGLTRLLEDYKKGEIKANPLVVAHLLGQIHFKQIALPCDPKYEPWTLDLVKRITWKGTLSFNFVRQTAYLRIRDEFRRQGYDVHPHTLRHWRLSHLMQNYGFEPYDISIYSGWSIRSTFNQMGMQASSNIDIYAHLTWNKYFPKLLIPIREV